MSWKAPHAINVGSSEAKVFSSLTMDCICAALAGIVGFTTDEFRTSALIGSIRADRSYVPILTLLSLVRIGSQSLPVYPRALPASTIVDFLKCSWSGYLDTRSLSNIVVEVFKFCII